MSAPKTPRPPANLSREAREVWTATCREFDLEAHHLAILRAACRELSRAEEAETIVGRDGLILKTPRGDSKPHPAAGVARNARIAAARLLRELALDETRNPYANRPPRAGSGARS
jgi:phage terminase small subunit